jgi:hypothetical protein
VPVLGSTATECASIDTGMPATDTWVPAPGCAAPNCAAPNCAVADAAEKDDEGVLGAEPATRTAAAPHRAAHPERVQHALDRPEPVRSRRTLKVNSSRSGVPPWHVPGLSAGIGKIDNAQTRRC